LSLMTSALPTNIYSVFSRARGIGRRVHDQLTSRKIAALDQPRPRSPISAARESGPEWCGRGLRDALLERRAQSTADVIPARQQLRAESYMTRSSWVSRVDGLPTIEQRLVVPVAAITRCACTSIMPGIIVSPRGSYGGCPRRITISEPDPRPRCDWSPLGSRHGGRRAAVAIEQMPDEASRVFGSAAHSWQPVVAMQGGRRAKDGTGAIVCSLLDRGSGQSGLLTQ